MGERRKTIKYPSLFGLLNLVQKIEYFIAYMFDPRWNKVKGATKASFRKVDKFLNTRKLFSLIVIAAFGMSLVPGPVFAISYTQPDGTVVFADPVEMDGAAQFDGSLKFTSGAQNGYVLQVDGDGNATWVAQSSLTGVPSAGISNVVEDTTPQLGGNLDVNGQDIVSISNANIDIVPNGSGVLNVDSGAIFNDSGADEDFRIEGDADTELFYVNAGTDQVGIGHAPFGFSGNNTDDKLTVVVTSPDDSTIARGLNISNLFSGTANGYGSSINFSQELTNGSENNLAAQIAMEVGGAFALGQRADLTFSNIGRPDGGPDNEFSEVMRITNTKRVGINTDAPSSALHVIPRGTDAALDVDGTSTLRAITAETDSTYDIGTNSVRFANGYFDTLHGDGSNLTNLPAATNVVLEDGNTEGAALTLGTNDTNALIFETDDTARVTIDTSGNVTTLTDVYIGEGQYGNINFLSAGDGNFNARGDMNFAIDANAQAGGGDTGHKFTWFNNDTDNNGTQVMVLTESGDLGLNTSSDPTDSFVVNADGNSFDSSWDAGTTNDGIAVTEADASLHLVSDDAGTHGSTIMFTQMDTSELTDFENMWSLHHMTPTYDTANGNENAFIWKYGTNNDYNSNSQILSLQTDGDMWTSGDIYMEPNQKIGQTTLSTLEHNIKFFFGGGFDNQIAVNAADSMYFNIDSNANSPSSAFRFAMNRADTSGGTELLVIDKATTNSTFAGSVISTGLDINGTSTVRAIAAETDSTYDIGTNSVRFANGYFDTLHGDGSNLTGVTGSDSDWTINGNDIYSTNTGNVGITETSPSFKLDVLDNDSVGGLNYVLNLESERASGSAAVDDGTGFTMGMENSGGFAVSAIEMNALWDDPTSTSEDSRIEFDVKVAGTSTEILQIDGGGLTLPASNTNITFDNAGSFSNPQLIFNGTNAGAFLANGVAGLTAVGSEASTIFLSSVGLGIGTVSPATKLTVNGTTTAQAIAVQTDSTYDIGTDTVRFANGYFDTLHGDGSNLTGIPAPSNAVLEDGNTEGAALTIGTNDTFALNLETDGTTRFTIETDGDFLSSSGSAKIGFNDNYHMVPFITSNGMALNSDRFIRFNTAVSGVNAGGFVWYAGDSDFDTATGNERMRLSESGSLSIGLNSTAAQLVVNDGAIFNEGGSAGAGFNVRMEGGTDANLFVAHTTNNQIGIGTNVTSAKLDVVGTSEFSDDMDINGGSISMDDAEDIGVNDNNRVLWDTSSFGNQFVSGRSLGFIVDADNGDADTRDFIFGKNATTQAGGSFTELMRLTEGGLLGIGKDPSAGVELDVVGDIAFTGTITGDGSGLTGIAAGAFTNDSGLIYSSGTPATDELLIGGIDRTSLDTNVNRADIVLDGFGETVFNERSLDNNDFRIETDSREYAIFVDASTNKIGFGTATPFNTFDFVADTTGESFDNSWNGNAISNGISILDSDATLDLVSDDFGTLGSIINMHQMDVSEATDFEDMWSILREVTTGVAGTGSLLFRYGTDEDYVNNSNLFEFTNDGDLFTSGFVDVPFATAGTTDNYIGYDAENNIAFVSTGHATMQAIGDVQINIDSNANTTGSATFVVAANGEGYNEGNETDLFTVNENGNATLTGTMTASAFSGDGSALTNLPSGSEWDDTAGLLSPAGGASDNVVIGATASGGEKLRVVGNFSTFTGDVRFSTTNNSNFFTMDESADAVSIGETAITESLLNLSYNNGNSTTVEDALTISKQTSLTAGIGMGTRIRYRLEDASGFNEEAAYIETLWDNPANGSEDARMSFRVINDGAIFQDTLTLTDDSVGIGGVSAPTATIEARARVADSTPVLDMLIFDREFTATGQGAVNEGSRVLFQTADASAGESDTAAISALWSDATSGSEDGRIEFDVAIGGSLVNVLDIGQDGHLLPGADSTYNIGATANRFTNVYADFLHGDGSNITNLPGGGDFSDGGDNFGGSPAVLGTNDSSNLQFETNDNVIMTIETTGEVGIGDTTPDSILDIAGNDPRLTIDDTSAAAYNPMLTFQQQGGAVGNQWTMGINNDDFSIALGTSLGAPEFIIDATNNNVGIGVSSANNPLSVSGTIATIATDPTIYFDTSSGIDVTMGIDNSESNFVISRSDTLGTNNVMVFDRTNGLVAFNATDVTNAFEYAFNVSSAGDAGLYVNNSSTGNAEIGFALSDTVAWSMGAQNADDDDFVISRGDGLGVSELFMIDGSNNNVRITDTGIAGNPLNQLEVIVDGTSDGIEINNIQSGDGDPVLGFDVDSVREYTIGVDSSDSSKFKISEFTTLGTNDRVVLSNGDMGLGGITNPTATLHLPAQLTAATSAPIKLTSGSLMTTPEAGAIEFDGTNLYYTNSSNVRQTLEVAGAGALFTDGGGTTTYLTDTAENLALGTSTSETNARLTIETNSDPSTLGIPIHLRHTFNTTTPDEGDGIKIVQVEMEDAETNPGTNQDAGDIRMVWDGEPVQGGGIASNFEFHAADGDAVGHVMTIFHDDKVSIGTTVSTAHTLTLNSNESTTTSPSVEITNAGTGDSSLQFTAGGQSYTMGIDNSSSNDFILGRGTALDGTFDNFRMHASNGNVSIKNNLGIGTATSPSDDLYIETAFSSGITINNSSTTDPEITLEIGGAETFTMGIDNSDSDKFKIGTTSVSTSTRLTIDSSGNVGINDTTPTAKLDVNGGIRPTIATSDPCGGASYPEGTMFYNDTSDYYCFCNGAGNDVQMHSPTTACF